MIILKNRTILKIGKGGVLEFLKIQFVAKYQKIERGPFGDIKNFSRKMKNENFEVS